MNACLSCLVLPAALLTLSCCALAQQTPARPAPAASAAAQSKTQPRGMTASEKADSATVPGDMRPEEPVVPQIQIPLGRRAVLPESRDQAQRRSKAEARGGIDDDVARCKAAADAKARDACLAQLKKPGRSP